MLRMFLGLEQFEFDLGILLEGYQLYTPCVRDPILRCFIALSLQKCSNNPAGPRDGAETRAFG